LQSRSGSLTRFAPSLPLRAPLVRTTRKACVTAGGRRVYNRRWSKETGGSERRRRLAGTAEAVGLTGAKNARRKRPPTRGAAGTERTKAARQSQHTRSAAGTLQRTVALEQRRYVQDEQADDGLHCKRSTKSAAREEQEHERKAFGATESPAFRTRAREGRASCTPAAGLRGL